MSGYVQVGSALLPVDGECGSDVLAQRVLGGQPVVLTVGGHPSLVVVDLESWAEVEETLCGTPST